MVTQITLTQSSINGGTPVRILAPTVVIGGQKNNNIQPHTSSQDRVEVQTQSRNNVTITLQQVKLIPSKYSSESSLTLGSAHNPSSFTSIGQAFAIEDPDVAATKTLSSEQTVYIGRTFNEEYVKNIIVDRDYSQQLSGLTVEYYDGSDWIILSRNLLSYVGRGKNTIPINRLCEGVRLSFTALADTTPTVSIYSMSFTIQGEIESAYLSWADIWKLYTQQYIGSNAATLNITYEDASDGSDESLFVISDSSAQTQETAIKVVLKSFTFNFNAQDSKNANQPTGTLVFEETA